MATTTLHDNPNVAAMQLDTKSPTIGPWKTFVHITPPTTICEESSIAAGRSSAHTLNASFIESPLTGGGSPASESTLLNAAPVPTKEERSAGSTKGGLDGDHNMWSCLLTAVNVAASDPPASGAPTASPPAAQKSLVQTSTTYSVDTHRLNPQNNQHTLRPAVGKEETSDHFDPTGRAEGKDANIHARSLSPAVLNAAARVSYKVSTDPPHDHNATLGYQENAPEWKPSSARHGFPIPEAVSRWRFDREDSDYAHGSQVLQHYNNPPFNDFHPGTPQSDFISRRQRMAPPQPRRRSSYNDSNAYELHRVPNYAPTQLHYLPHSQNNYNRPAPTFDPGMLNVGSIQHHQRTSAPPANLTPVDLVALPAAANRPVPAPVISQETKTPHNAPETPTPSPPPNDISITTIVTTQAKSSRATKHYPCPFEGCKWSFTRRFNLKVHAETHNPDRVRPHACPSCGKAFARVTDLKRHRKIHDRGNAAAGAAEPDAGPKRARTGADAAVGGKEKAIRGGGAMSIADLVNSGAGFGGGVGEDGEEERRWDGQGETYYPSIAVPLHAFEQGRMDSPRGQVYARDGWNGMDGGRAAGGMPALEATGSGRRMC